MDILENVLVFSSLAHWNLFLVATITLGLVRLLRIPYSPHSVDLGVRLQSWVSLAFGTTAVIAWIRAPAEIHRVFPPWFRFHDYHFDLAILIDHRSALFQLLFSLIWLVIIRFSLPSFIRDSRHLGFYLLLNMLGLGVQTLLIAGNLDLSFVGWELTGVASVFLIGFFDDQPRSVTNSLRAFSFYRVCDAFFIVATLLAHHLPSNDFHEFRLHSDWQMTAVGLMLILATLAKSSQFPFVTWLPRAMEGPTSSSAIFYGALSVHLGPYLLLRCSELWNHSVELRILLATAGALTSFYATWVGSTRSDAKTQLAFSTMGQVGLIYIELALRLETLAWVHLLAHASLRTWQYLKASSLLQDFQENPTFSQELLLGRTSFRSKQMWVHAFHGFYIDALFENVIWRILRNRFRSARGPK